MEDDLKQGGGVRQTTDGDQGLHRKVVTANVTEQRKRDIRKRQRRKMFKMNRTGFQMNEMSNYNTANLLPSPLYTHMVEPIPVKAELQ